MNRFLRLGAALALLLAGPACDRAPSVTAPLVPEAELSKAQNALRFVHRDAKAPPFARARASFVAVAGEGNEMTIHFADGSPLATFRVGPESLRDATLGGARLAAGDTVRITLQMADGSRFLVDLQPSGLRFNPEAPAELVFHYRHAAAVRHPDRLTVWRQESEGDPWTRLGGTPSPETLTLSAPIDGFTRFAMSH